MSAFKPKWLTGGSALFLSLSVKGAFAEYAYSFPESVSPLSELA